MRGPGRAHQNRPRRRLPPRQPAPMRRRDRAWLRSLSNASGPSGSTASPHSWTKKNDLNFPQKEKTRPPKPPAKPSLTIKRRLDAPPAKVFASLDRPGKTERCPGWAPAKIGRQLHVGNRSARRRPSTAGVDAGARAASSTRSAVTYREVSPEPKAGLHLGLADDARARVAGDRAARSLTAAAHC